jgi:hypothetical protein
MCDGEDSNQLFRIRSFYRQSIDRMARMTDDRHFVRSIEHRFLVFFSLSCPHATATTAAATIVSLRVLLLIEHDLHLRHLRKGRKKPRDQFVSRSSSVSRSVRSSVELPESARLQNSGNQRRDRDH